MITIIIILIKPQWIRAATSWKRLLSLAWKCVIAGWRWRWTTCTNLHSPIPLGDKKTNPCQKRSQPEHNSSTAGVKGSGFFFNVPPPTPTPPYNRHRTFPQRTWNLDKWGPLCVYLSIYCILCNVPVKQRWKFVWNIISNKVGNLFAFCTCMPYTQCLWMKLNASWHQNESSKSFVGGVGKLVVTAEAKEPCGTCTNMQPVGDDQLNTSSGVSNLRRDWPVVIAASVCVT